MHIGVKPGEIADKILLPEGPLRAKYTAETFLKNPVCYNRAREMLGYTRTCKGQRVSVQGVGTRTLSTGIYARELINSYGVKKLIRVDMCGSISGKVNARELAIAQVAAMLSSAIRNGFSKYDFPQIASFDLLLRSYEVAKARGFVAHADNILSDDALYKDSLGDVFRLDRYGVLAIEMEAAMLYYLAARSDVEVLAIMTVSDDLVTGEETTAGGRRATLNEMIEVDLETAVAN